MTWAFAQQPGLRARDGLYTPALAARLRTGCGELNSVFDDVSAQVRVQSGEEQAPERTVTSSGQRFVFRDDGSCPPSAAEYQRVLAELAAAKSGQRAVEAQLASVAPAQSPGPKPGLQPAPSPAPSPTATAGSGVVGSSGYVLRLVPAGEYMVGCPSVQGGGCEDDEKPARRVRLSRSVLVGETEVTQGLYHRLMGRNPSRFTSCGYDCPVEQVSWYDAVEVANALSAAEGLEPCYVI